MRNNLNHLKKYVREHSIFKVMGHGLNGMFFIPSPIQKTRILRVMSSDGEGWDHVSISLSGRCPNWDEMAYIKDLFFKESETVVQYHPKKSEYVNNCGSCLHLWRDQGQEHKLPPSFMVGIK